MSDQLPDGWRLTTIGDLAEFQSGGTPSKKNDAFWGHDVPFVTAADLRVIEIDRDCARSFLTEDGWNSGKTAQALPGSVLLGTRTGVGRVGVATERIAASQDITVLDCVSDVDPRWLARFLSSRSDDLVAAASGATIQGITRKFLKGIEVALPPLDEQRHAVARLDEQLMTAGRARVAAQAQLAAIEAMPQALLRQIFPRSPGGRLPPAWRWATLGEVTTSSANVDPRRNPDVWFTYIDISGIDRAAKRIRETKRIVGSDAPSRARRSVQAGDVIVSTTRPNLNAVALIPDSYSGAICSTGFCVLRCKPDADEAYLYQIVQTEQFIDQMTRDMTGASYPAVTDKVVRTFEFPLPPIDEQRRIVREIDEQTAAIERARAAAQAQLDAIDALPTAALRLTFAS